MTDSEAFEPSRAVGAIEAYEVPRPETPVDVHLDGNEGQPPPETFLESVEELSREEIRSYPGRDPVMEAISDRHDIPKERLIVTAGADEAIMRTCRVALEPGRKMVLPQPTFSMMPRFSSLVGAEVDTLEWTSGDYPADDVIERIDEKTGLVVVVSPNNPTGLTASDDDIRRLAEAAKGAIVLVDHAYVEFADEDLTHLAVEYDNVVVTRTLSKAWGMAGLRVGYAVAAPKIVDWLDAAGNPYPVSGPSVRISSRRVATAEEDVEDYIERVRGERTMLGNKLRGYGADVTESEGNFVFGHFDEAAWLHDALAGMGIAVRAFPDEGGLSDALRITCPGDTELFGRLNEAFETIFEPQALFLDLDGVLADVSGSYRQAIRKTAAHYGLTLSDHDVSEAKSEGEANNDWILTQRLLSEAGIEVEFEEVKSTYEAFYQGEGERRGLWRNETLMYEIERLEELAAKIPLGIVTGRPQRDADRFFEHTGLGDVVEATVCMEDAPQKPEPDPVELLAERMGVERAWLFGDTPDDARAARAAGFLPLGTIAPGEDEGTMRPALIEAGCARVLDDLDELEELLP
mgnify:CR=1 FL=1